MNNEKKKALGLRVSISKNMEKFRDISKELLTPEDLKWELRNQESLAIEKAQKEQMTNVDRIIKIQDK